MCLYIYTYTDARWSIKVDADVQIETVLAFKSPQFHMDKKYL